jgi:hypothetical protein
MINRACPYCFEAALTKIGSPSSTVLDERSLPDSVFECESCGRKVTSWLVDRPELAWNWVSVA